MCYFLRIASPLTLSEIRSMLPAGIAADLAPSAERVDMLRRHPPAKTVARLLVGACSCDLVRPRLHNSIDDEREHRARYQQGKLSRTAIIRELERHRRGPVPRPGHPSGWPAALAGFVAEHARNAGPTLYQLDFVASDGPLPDSLGSEPIRWSAQQVKAAPQEWLPEGLPVVVG